MSGPLFFRRQVAAVEQTPTPRPTEVGPAAARVIQLAMRKLRISA